MSILVLLLVGSMGAGPSCIARPDGSGALEIEAMWPETEAGDTSDAIACLVPAPGGRLPRIEGPSADLVRASLGRVAVAGGVSVAPFILERVNRDATCGPVKTRARLIYEHGWQTNEQRRGVMAACITSGWDRAAGQGETDGAGLLIIVPDDFYDNILPLALWKERKGFQVSVKKTSETGNTTDAIRTYIQTAYNTWDPAPDYVVLVGAINKMPAFYRAGTPCVTDHPYSCVDGADYLSDLFVGRLPAANASELDVIVAKILGYEKTPYLADTTWYHRALMVGTSYQQGGTPAVTALVTKREIRQRLLGHGFNQVDTVFYPPTGNGRGPVDTAVNRGVLFINGRGWGNNAGWGYPQFLIADVTGLQNGWKLPVVTSIYCGTGNYEFNPCFGEMWLRAGTPTVPKGGVAFWGSSYTSTSTRWNNAMDYGIYQAILDHGVTASGPAMYAGKLTQYRNFPLPADSWDLCTYFHVYNLLGDPSMQMWTEVPRSITVNYPSTFAVGTSRFEVIVLDGSGQPVRDALVCLSKAGEVHETIHTDAAGRAAFAIATSTVDSMLVTVTGANLVPHLGKSTGLGAGVFVGHLSHDPTSITPGVSASLSVTLKNFGGSQTAAAVQATLRTRDSSATVTDSVRSCGDIPPGGTSVASGFGVTIAPACTSGQLVRLELVARSGDSSWASAFDVPVVGPTLRAGGYTVPGGNGVLDPGETAELAVNVRNTGAAASGGMSAVLRSLNPAAVQVLDSAGTYPSLAPGDSAENSLDRFQVRASDGIGVGRRFSLRLVLQGADGFEQHSDFTITVGQPTTTTPLGPDKYGYYAYDNTDAGYPERPDFNWIEIDPAQGGPGTHIPITNDTTATIALPFPFRYYGRQYTQASICDNGYLALGPTSLGDAYNWHIPSPMGPEALAAVFWDDFRSDTLGVPGIYIWDDAAGHRFIIQWSRVLHVHGFKQTYLADTQSFELILHDPAYYPTRTGDGPVLMQYLQVKNDDTLPDNNHNYATVGIQSPDRADGIEYTFANRYPVAAAAVEDGRAIRFTTNPPDSFIAVRDAPIAGRRTGLPLIWPVPARGRVELNSGPGPARVAILDVSGRQVRQYTVTGRQSWVSLCGLAQGVYQVVVVPAGAGRVQRARVVVLNE